jgi:hypothetical protein
MLQIKYLLVVGLLFLSACVTKPNVPQTQIKEQSLSDQLNKAVAYSDQCLSKYDNNPDFLLTYQEISLRGENPPNKQALLSSNKKLNAKQKRALQNYIKLSAECTQGVLSLVKGSQFFDLFAKTEASLDALNSGLLEEKMTIGEANYKQLEITRKFYEDVSALLKQSRAQ